MGFLMLFLIAYLHKFSWLFILLLLSALSGNPSKVFSTLNKLDALVVTYRS